MRWRKKRLDKKLGRLHRQRPHHPLAASIQEKPTQLSAGVGMIKGFSRRRPVFGMLKGHLARRGGEPTMLLKFQRRC